ncbi:MAG: hypothetical protein HY744_29850 [Deltaproteobacteria bacterium]|nr:hypothetical protein [Deltaproteobacteria bacterium]
MGDAQRAQARTGRAFPRGGRASARRTAGALAALALAACAAPGEVSRERGTADRGYALERAQDGLGAVGANRAQGLGLELGAGALRLRTLDGTDQQGIELRWTRLGRGRALAAVPEAGCDARIEGGRASWRRGAALEEWYVNGPAGIEQGFVLGRPPAGAGATPQAATIEVAVASAAPPALRPDGRGASLYGLAGRALQITDLGAFDATGRRLGAWMELDGRALRLRIDDRDARYPVLVDPLVWTEEAKLAESAPKAGAMFGFAVAWSGQAALVSAPSAYPGCGAGRVDVFEPSGALWSVVQQLGASDAADGNAFGWSLSVDGDSALVGATTDPSIPLLPVKGTGAAYVFAHGPGGWAEVQKLSASAPEVGDAFGMAVAIEGDTAAVGAPYDHDPSQGPDAGAAYVFARSGGAWPLVQKLLAGDGGPGHQFGSALALDGDTLLVGARGHDEHGTKSGAVYVFARSGGLWSEQQRLHAHDEAAGDRFGWSLGLDAQTAMVSAETDDDSGLDSGSVYVFTREGGSPFAEQQKLLAKDGTQDDELGFSLALRGDLAAVGAIEQSKGVAPGYALLFERSAGVWTETHELVGSAVMAGSNFGQAVALGEATVLVGAPIEQNGTGAAFVFAHSKWDLGDPCATLLDCASGHCTDGVCCDAACGDGSLDDCQACSVAAGGQKDGVCAPREDGATCDDALACNGADRCAGGACAEHSTAPPCPGPDGDEDCHESCLEQAGGHACNGYDGDGAACAGAGRCEQGSCQHELGASCREAAGCQSGRCTDGRCCLQPGCAPYRCGPSGACRASCRASGECAAGFQCTSAGECVPTAGPPAGAGGCGCRAAGRGPAGSAPWLLGLLVALWTARWRRAAPAVAALALVGLAGCDGGADPPAGPRLGASRDELVWSQEQRLAAGDATTGDLFGFSVALRGATALLGAPSNPLYGTTAGSVYVFAHTEASWTQSQQLAASDSATGDGFGWSLALDGDAAIVGATMDPGIDKDFPGPGAAYLFARSGGQWAQVQKVAPAGGVRDAFGIWVALDGGTAVVGASHSDDCGADSGSVYVFVHEGDSWTQQAKLLASDCAKEDHFGIAVDVDGETIIVGALTDDDNGPSSGSAYVYVRSGGVWTEQAKLVASDGSPGDKLGWSVALRGDAAIVGAAYDSDLGVKAGSAYAFVRSAGAWTEEAKLVASDAAPGAMFGVAVAVDADAALVGASQTTDELHPGPGAAYVFARSGDIWTEQQKLAANPAGDYALGRTVAWDGARALLGAPADPGNGPGAGSAFVFALRREDGLACSLPTDCLSGFCVDGVCCNSACGGGSPDDCMTCSRAFGGAVDGACQPLHGASCDDGLYCNGADRCWGAECADHFAAPCPGPDGDDDCHESCDEQARACGAYDGEGTACSHGTCVQGACRRELGAACVSGSDCQSGFCVSGGCCALSSCAPHRCGKAGVCLATCSATTDCAAGYQCSSAGDCVPAAGAGAGGESGCGCATPGRRGMAVRGAALVLVLAAGLIRRGRGKASQTEKIRPKTSARNA